MFFSLRQGNGKIMSYILIELQDTFSCILLLLFVETRNSVAKGLGKEFWNWFLYFWRVLVHQFELNWTSNSNLSLFCFWIAQNPSQKLIHSIKPFCQVSPSMSILHRLMENPSQKPIHSIKPIVPGVSLNVYSAQAHEKSFFVPHETMRIIKKLFSWNWTTNKIGHY